MINKPSNNEVSESIKYSKKKQKEERKNENNKEKNDFKKRIEKIHEGEKLSPISKILKHNVDSGKRIRIYRNGDAFHKGINIVVNMKHVHDIDVFLETISERIGLIHGAKKIYTLQGHLIRSTKELENNNEYVASSEAYISLPYGSFNTREWHSGHNPERSKRGNSASAVSKEDSGISLTASKKSAPGRFAAYSRQSHSTEPRQYQKKKEVLNSRAKTSTLTKKKENHEKTLENIKSKDNNKHPKNQSNSKTKLETDEQKKKIHKEGKEHEIEHKALLHENEKIEEEEKSHKTNEEIDDSSSKASEETKEITKNEESELKSKSEILSTKSKKSQENDIFLIENIL